MYFACKIFLYTYSEFLGWTANKMAGPRRNTIFIAIVTMVVCSQLAHYCHAQMSNKKTLIIVDKANNIPGFKKSHSSFVNLVETLGQDVEIKSADDSSLKLSKYGEILYDNILIMCPQLEPARGQITRNDIVEFIDAGKNVLLVGGHPTGSLISDLAKDVGFEFTKSATKREFPNTELNDIYHIVGHKSKYPNLDFSYSGAQFKMYKNELSLAILTNSAPVDDIRPTHSSKFVPNVLIGAMQARNNARVIVSGSLEFYTDKAFQSSKQSNKHLTLELLRWLTKEKSLLRFSQVQHRKLNIDPSPSTDIASRTHFEGYTIMDDLEYKINIEIYEDGKWNHYKADDVQFEFVRIDPFVRQTMQIDPDGNYVARFKVPDVYGVYKMEVDYKRDGLTYLFSTTQVSVRPLRHNEYERFIFSAYPYYLSAFLMMAYLYVFSFVYLYQQKVKRSNK